MKEIVLAYLDGDVLADWQIGFLVEEAMRRDDAAAEELTASVIENADFVLDEELAHQFMARAER